MSTVAVLRNMPSLGDHEILHVDNHLLVVAKPACVPTVPDSSGDMSLFDAARGWVKQAYDKPGEAFLGIVHRLDRPVSGVVVFARTSKAASRLSEAFRSRKIHKAYLGVVPRAPEADEGTVEQHLIKDRQRNRVRAVAAEDEGSRLARTHWRVLARRPDRTLLELIPETGRPHQLRLAAVALGSPLLGDLKYGAGEPLEDRSIALHAREIRLEHPTTRAAHRFECASPSTSPWRF